MPKKHDLIELNRSRELHRRLLLVKTRLKDMPVESSYASGRIRKLPNNIPTPPSWALAAARLATDSMSKSIAHLKPKAGEPYKIGDLLELIGYFYAIVSFVQRQAQAIGEEGDEIPGLTKLHNSFSKRTAKSYARFLRGLTRHLKPKAAMPSAEVLIQMNERQNKGLSGFATPEGEIRDFTSATVRIYYLVWMFWPDLKHEFNAPFIHLWLKKEIGESTSDKTVEAVVTRIRKLARNPNFTD